MKADHLAILAYWATKCPQSWWHRFVLQTTPRARSGISYLLSDASAEILRAPGLEDQHRIIASAHMGDFAFWVSDRAVDAERTKRYAHLRKAPPGGAAIRDMRRAGTVPAPFDGVHVAVCLDWTYQRFVMAGLPIVVVPRDRDPEYLDFTWAAGLSVRLYSTAADGLDICALKDYIAAGGAARIDWDCLDLKPARIDVLYRGGNPWRL
jgi:hypothetical protein